MKPVKIFTCAAILPLLLGAFSGKASAECPCGDNTYVPLSLSATGREFISKGELFSYEFLEKINAEAEGDYIISPLSMQILLGMILEGAEGQTASEISSVLGYGEKEGTAVGEFVRSLLDQLPELDKTSTLSLADAIFVNQELTLSESYRRTLSKYYDAGIGSLDFNERKASADIINKWCSDHTDGMITKVIDEVSPQMLCYLLNALYFQSKWESPFKARLTSEEIFTDESGAMSGVQMMKQNAYLNYAEGEICQAVTLPYGNGAFSMTVLLPKEGRSVSDIVKALKSGKNLTGDARSCRTEVWLPRFETKFGVKLNDILSAMGMPLAFDRRKADFSKMSIFALCLDYVRQDAAIKVDEDGTEAAAVSSAAVIAKTSFDPSLPVIFHADHPFLYLITEKSTGAILFAGRYSNRPSQ